MIHLSIVIPAYNESKRLPSTLGHLKKNIESGVLSQVKIETVYVVDDGSADNTIQVAREQNWNLVKIISSDQNYGKGHAIRLGLKAVSTEYALIADADMSTPWSELNRLTATLLKSNSRIAVGSRDLPASQLGVRQPFLRQKLGRLFNFYVRLLTGLTIQDTQCGFKLFHMPSVQPFLDKLTVNRFAWDVEFLYVAHKNSLKMTEVPIQWNHVGDSRVSPLRDGLQMAWTVLKLKFRHF